jgi:hypothetical protein
MIKQYIYIFVRNDLSKEQQIIQASHAMYDVGVKQSKNLKPNVVLIDVSNELELHEVQGFLTFHKIKYEMFYEPDISAYTAIATWPITGTTRSPLAKFNTMKA